MFNRDLTDALARDLADASFTGGGVATRVGEAASAALHRMVAEPARRAALRQPGRLSTLLRAFWLGDPVTADEFADALPSLGVDGAVALGIAERHGEAVAPLVVIRPHAYSDHLGEGTWWIASDLDELAGVFPLRPDHVLGVGGAARTLAALLPQTPVGTGLDLGTGCGIIALHLRRIAEHVVATDISERALWFTELTAAINAVDGIETRLGSLFAPVAGARFDLIASNPPFVITPRIGDVPSYEYRDGGAAGDALMAAVVGGLSDHLLPGGHARLLGNWEARDDRTGLERVRDWTAGAGLDVWAIERDALDPVQYAEMWLRDGGTLPRDSDHDRLLDAWLDDFDARGVTAIGMGWLALRRPSGDAVGDRAAGPPSVMRLERITQAVQFNHVGTHLEAALEIADRIARLDDAALADAHLLTAADVTEARHQLPGAAGPNVIELRQGGALGRTLSVDSALAALVGACDGELSVAQLIGAIASLLEVDEAILTAGLLPRIRELLITGFLLPTDDDPLTNP